MIDRDAIVARRAAFIASALSGICVATAANAQPRPTGGTIAVCPRRDASAEDIARAKELSESARAAMEARDWSAATKSMSEAYASFPSDGVATLWMEATLLAGSPEEAIAIGKRHVECGGDPGIIAAKTTEIEDASARVVVAITGPGEPTVTVLLDGRPVARERAKAGLSVAAGRHSVSVRTPGGLTVEKQFELGERQSTTVDIVAPKDEGPHPLPCLSPVRKELEGRVRLSGGLVVPQVVAEPFYAVRIYAGGGVRAAIAARIFGPVWVEGDGFGTVTANPVGELVYAGTSVSILVYLEDHFGAGIGVTAGRAFQFAREDGEPEGALPFVGPVFTPVSLWFGPVAIQLKLPVCLAIQGDTAAPVPSTTFAPFVSLALGGTVVR